MPIVDVESNASTRVTDEDPPYLTRDQRRSRRKRAVRAKTVSIKRMTKIELQLGQALYPKEEHPFPMAGGPTVRSECHEVRGLDPAGNLLPCPYVSCRHNLYLDINPKSGAIKMNFPDLQPQELAVSCALDVADRDGATLEEVGAILNVTRERIRQIEVSGMARVNALLLSDYVENENRSVVRHLRVIR